MTRPYECDAKFIDGSWYGCGCPECEDDDDGDLIDERREGGCDNCTMAPGETTGPPFYVGCACAMGQGAPPDECRCGPDPDAEPATGEAGRWPV